MSLPAILKFVYNHGTEEVIKRGKKIFYSSGVQMLDVDHLAEQVRFRVKNDQYQNYYTVTINKYLTTTELAARCQCPYNMGEICRHEVAALFQLNDIIQSGFFENMDVSYDQKHTVVRMRQVSKQVIQIFTAPESLDKAEDLLSDGMVTLAPGKNEKIEAEVVDGKTKYKVTIKQNEERYFDTSCQCKEARFPLCAHKTATFLQVLKKLGAEFFQTMQNWDFQKNKLLEQYGYSLSDDLKGKFTFTYENGKPFLRVLDPTIKKISQGGIPAPKKETVAIPVIVHETKRLGIIVDTAQQNFPYVDFKLVAATTDEADTKLLEKEELLELHQFLNPLRFVESDRDLLPVVRKFNDDELVKYVKKNLPFGDLLPDEVESVGARPSNDVREQLWEYLLPKYQKLLQRFNVHPFKFIRPQGKSSQLLNLPDIEFGEMPAHPQLEVKKSGRKVTINLEWIIENNAVAFKDVKLLNAALVLYKNKIYALSSLKEVIINEHFEPDGLKEIPTKEWPAYLRDYVMDWNSKIHVHFSEEFIERVSASKPQKIVYLQERDNTFMIQPKLAYEGMEIGMNFHGDVIEPHNGIVKIVQRNPEIEAEFADEIKALHNELTYNKREGTYQLSGAAVLSNNWFFKFTKTLKDSEIELRGLDRLRNLRVNTNVAETIINVSSGIDWFDATIELSFGDQKVSISDVKKALGSKQNYVKLGDGSLGMLPDDWLKKYSLLLKVGETKGNKVRLKKYHFSVLDELMAELDEGSILKELESKKVRLESIIDNDYSNTKAPDHLEAVLRPYQYAGFHWLKFLNEAGWGGILADDMGLGKTIQTLAFFQHYKNTHKTPRYLVICPTTLMFNWENEINKFTPTLTKYIHHGPKRSVSPQIFEGYDVVITTYGTMRSDIKMLKDIEFDYVVLDESQSIKNPQSQVAKASLLLQSKNRLALSGTPLQNNTFDLYAQMNFLNPGMLGSREFFMSEFATPIDKFRESEAKVQLKQLTYPFLLRRTKEQVAKDLPEKTEIILYCEMGNEQRKIYEAYRNTYRSKILGMIEERGMERSQMHILQGLTKLRQICDSPAILKESEKLPNHSIKLDELSREIMENVGDHKVLIFSQFLGMLGLIRQRLEEEKIHHVYFDGSSTSTQREDAINEFQSNHDCRVFLISLKAGGIGLNLTAADYVYIVDPWWNPAVEQQAIDRTHRIGQTKNIFAYRLICKDSLEEKMLQLQESKRTLANDLVSDDNAIMKRLTKDDIAFLFS